MVEVKFVVTGFGPFDGANENPTQLIATALKQYLASNAATPTHDEFVASLQTIVIDTCAEDARSKIDDIYDKIGLEDEDDCLFVVLHLGVNVCGKHFQLEECAYNDASFRIPDERNYQPNRTKIVTTARFGKCFRTPIDVASLRRSMNSLSSQLTTKTVVSRNPGRFVCNYSYCYSLSTVQSKFAGGVDDACSIFHSSAPPGRVFPIFLHVPPLEVCALPNQLQYVAHLLVHLKSMVKSNYEDPRWSCFTFYEKLPVLTWR